MQLDLQVIQTFRILEIPKSQIEVPWGVSTWDFQISMCCKYANAQLLKPQPIGHLLVEKLLYTVVHFVHLAHH